MDLKKADRKGVEPGNIKRNPKMTLNKDARMFLLMAKVQQTNSEALQEQNSLLDAIKNTRNAIKEELKIMKGTLLEKPEEAVNAKEEPIELVETETTTKFDINPNLEIVRQIKKKAKSKLNTGHHKPEDVKHSYSNTNGVHHVPKPTKTESSNGKPPFKC